MSESSRERLSVCPGSLQCVTVLGFPQDAYEAQQLSPVGALPTHMQQGLNELQYLRLGEAFGNFTVILISAEFVKVLNPTKKMPG